MYIEYLIGISSNALIIYISENIWKYLEKRGVVNRQVLSGDFFQLPPVRRNPLKVKELVEADSPPFKLKEKPFFKMKERKMEEEPILCGCGSPYAEEVYASLSPWPYFAFGSPAWWEIMRHGKTVVLHTGFQVEPSS
jgi:hypothetical protein